MVPELPVHIIGFTQGIIEHDTLNLIDSEQAANNRVKSKGGEQYLDSTSVLQNMSDLVHIKAPLPASQSQSGNFLQKL